MADETRIKRLISWLTDPKNRQGHRPALEYLVQDQRKDAQGQRIEERKNRREHAEHKKEPPRIGGQQRQ